MRELVPILVATLLLLCFAGAVTLCLLPSEWRTALFPGLPAIGAMTLVPALYATTLVLPTRHGIWVVIATGIAVLAVRARHAHWWDIDRRTLGVAAVAMCAGLVPLYIALGPARDHGAEVVQVTLNNDGFAYVSVASWLEDHRAVSPPQTGVDAPGYGYAALHLGDGLRIGDELVQAGVAELTHHDPAQNWYAITCLFLFLLPGSAAAAFRTMRLRSWTGLGAGALASVSAVAGFQVFNSNSDSLMGMAIAPLAIALIVARLAPAGEWRPPLWPAAGALSALIGTYTEYVPAVAAGLLVFALARSPAAWLRVGREGMLLLLTAAAMGPLIWYNAERALRTDAGAGAGLPSPFTRANPATYLERFLGLARMDAAGHLAVSLVMGAVIAALLAVAVIGLAHWRWLVIGLLANMSALAIYLAPDRGYSTARVVETALPIVLVLAGLGADVLVTWAGRSRPRRLRMPSAAALVMVAIAALVLGGMNVGTTRELIASQRFDNRYVTNDFSEVATWLKRYAGTGGGGVAVLDEDFFDQLWALYALRADPGVSYPFLYGDYAHQVSFNWHPNQQPLRWLVAGALEVADADPNVVVASNSRFRLLDLTRGSALVVLPTPPAWAGSDARGANWIGDGGHLITIRTADVRTVDFTTQTAIPAHATIAFSMLNGSTPVWSGMARSDQTTATMTLPPQTVVDLSLQRAGAGPPQPVDPSAPPPFWIQIGSIRRG